MKTSSQCWWVGQESEKQSSPTKLFEMQWHHQYFLPPGSMLASRHIFSVSENPKQKNCFHWLRYAEPGEGVMGNLKCQAGCRLLAIGMK